MIRRRRLAVFVFLLSVLGYSTSTAFAQEIPGAGEAGDIQQDTEAAKTEDNKEAQVPSRAVAEEWQQQLEERLELLFDIPGIPAARALEIDQSVVARPTTVRRVAAELGGFFFDELDESRTLAVEVAPFLLLKPTKRTVEEYNDASQILESVRLSFGVREGELNDTASLRQTSIGLRFSALNERDFRYDDEAVKTLRALHERYFPRGGTVTPGVGGGIADAQDVAEQVEEGVQLNEALKDAYGRLEGGWRVDLAGTINVATLEDVTGNQDSNLDSASAWITADDGLGMGNSWGFALQWNGADEQLDSWDHDVQLGTQLHIDTGWFEGGAGLAGAVQLTKPESDWETSLAGLASAQARFVYEESLSLGLGVQMKLDENEDFQSVGIVTVTFANSELWSKVISSASGD